MSCEKNVRQNDWKDSNDVLELPMSEVVCLNNGFDLVFKIVVDHNVKGNTFWLGAQGGLVTAWSESGAVRVQAYTKRVNIWTGHTRTQWERLEASTLDVKVGEAIYSAKWDSVKEVFILPPEALKPLSEAYKRNLVVKIRILDTVNEIGSDTVRAFAALYPQPIYSNLSRSSNTEYPTIRQLEPFTDVPIERPITQPQPQNTTSSPSQLMG